MTEPASYATVDDLEDFWRPLSEAEQARATVLLALASSRLRLYGKKVGVDVDAQVQDDPDYAQTAQWVVMEATKRALSTPVDTPPVDSFQQTAGPYSENYRFTNPSGDLWFKKAELASLGIAGNQVATSITPNTRKDIYGE